MVSSDTVVGIVGAVILTGAMIAVFYYENTNAEDGGNGALIGDGPNTYTFTYRQANATAVEPTTKTISSIGGTAQETFDLPAYVFNVHAVVTWTDDDTAPAQLASGEDQLKVELINEADALLEDDQNRDGEIALTHGHGPGDSNTTPPQQTVIVAGTSEADARQALQNATSEGHGVGTWTVKVTLVDTGTRAGADQTDTSQDFSITVHYSYWEPQLDS